jgi:hypothetical protein
VSGRYESHYLRVVDPARPRGTWIRHTTHQAPGEEAAGALWCTVWDAEAGPPYAVKQRVPFAGAPPAPLRGHVEALDRVAAWELEVAGEAAPLRHLPWEWMYRAPLPRTKPESPQPDAVFTGWLEAGGRRTEVAGWRGMVGHNWGTEHAERWAWIHAAGFEGGVPGDHLDVAAGRVRIGPVTTRWIANGQLVLGGETYRLGGVTRAYGTEIEEQPTECRFVLPGKGIAVRGSVGAAASEFVGWIYADPGGGEHHAVNSSVANLEMRIERPGRKHVHLQVGGAAYELGMRETDHGIPIQPYPDG